MRARADRVAELQLAERGARDQDCVIGAASPRSGDLAAHVGGHQVVLRRPACEQLLVERQRLADLALRDAADREADVVQDVVADGDRLVDDVEADLAPHAPEIDRRACCRRSSTTLPGTPRHITPPTTSRLPAWTTALAIDRLAEREAAVARRHRCVQHRPVTIGPSLAQRCSRRAARSGTHRRSAPPAAARARRQQHRTSSRRRRGQRVVEPRRDDGGRHARDQFAGQRAGPPAAGRPRPGAVPASIVERVDRHLRAGSAARFHSSATWPSKRDSALPSPRAPTASK